MSTRNLRRGFTLVELLVVIAIIAILVLLLLPAINAAREAARRNGCLNNMRSMAIAVQNHESAQKRYPVASNGTGDIRLGTTAGDAALDAFSWLFYVLPYVEEEILFKEMKKSINANSIVSPFDTAFVPAGGTGTGGTHYATSQIPSFRCPSFSGDTTTTLNGATNVEAAVGNYCALIATDLGDKAGSTWKTTNNWENGALPSACWTVDETTAPASAGDCTERGIRLKNLGDGISKTMIACESREEEFNAWISGACMWATGTSIQSELADTSNTQLEAGTGFVSMSNPADGAGLALNCGTEEATPTAPDVYLDAADWVTGETKVWGPSSEHSGNIVIHVFADAHAQAISAEVDGTTYLRFISRSAGDPADADKIE